MHGHPGHSLALRREAPFRIKRAEELQQSYRLVPARCWRRSHPREAVPFERAPRAARKNERGEVRVENLRHRLLRTKHLLSLAPEPVAHSRPHAPGASAALLSPVLRQRKRHEARHASTGREARHAHQPAVYDRRHPLYRNRRLRNGRRKHHLALRRRLEDLVLLLLRKASVERKEPDAAPLGVRRQRFEATPDLPLARQKAKHVAVSLPKGVRHTGRDRDVAEVLRLHREHAPLGAHYVRIAEMRRHLVRIQRCGHHKQAQVWPQGAPHIEGERESGVAVQGALVEFIEHDESDVRKLRIGKKPLREKPFGDDLEARLRGYLPLEPHLVAHRSADRLAAPARDVGRAVPGREPARFKDNDLPAFKPRLVDKGWRNARRLSAAGRRRQHDVPVRGERAANLGYLLLYRKSHAAPG